MIVTLLFQTIITITVAFSVVNLIRIVKDIKDPWIQALIAGQVIIQLYLLVDVWNADI